MHHNTPYLKHIENLGNENNFGLITGIVVFEDEKYYNAVIGLGSASGKYLKQYLVPFGEFVPFSTLLNPVVSALTIPIQNLSSGKNIQQNILLGDKQIATFICYEIAYEGAFRDSRKHSNLFVTVNNDAWFGESKALWQHLQIARYRSIQSARYQVVATNTGISAVINPKGEITDTIPPFKTGVLNGEVYYAYGQTIWSQFGDIWIVMILAIFLGLISLIQLYTRYK